MEMSGQKCVQLSARSRSRLSFPQPVASFRRIHRRMTNAAPKPPPLRCERCRYDLTGLKRNAHCSECGRIVASSLPDRHPGSEFQQSPSLRSWFRISQFAWRTTGDWRNTLRPSAKNIGRLELFNLIVAAVLFCVTVGFAWFVIDRAELGPDPEIYPEYYQTDFSWYDILGFLSGVGLFLLYIYIFRLLILILSWTIIVARSGYPRTWTRALVANAHGAAGAILAYLIFQIAGVFLGLIASAIPDLFNMGEKAPAAIWGVLTAVGTILALVSYIVFVVNASHQIVTANLPGSEARLAPSPLEGEGGREGGGRPDEG